MGRRWRWVAALATVVGSVPGVSQPAAAATAIGQLSGSPSAQCIGNAADFLNPTVTSGNSYVVPSLGQGIVSHEIISWSTNATSGDGQMLKFKVFRQVGEPAIFQVVASDLRPLTPSQVNSFAVDIDVSPGDVIGLNSVNPGAVPNACIFVAPGDSQLYRVGDLGDGQAASFGPNPNRRVNVTAVVEPSDDFSFGRLTTNKKAGTATLRVNVPNPGELTLSGKGVKRASAAGATTSKKVAGAGTVKLVIKANRKAKAKLEETGRVRVKAKVTFTPTGGDPSSAQTRKVNLRKA